MPESPEVYVAKEPNREPVRQFSIYADNKVGRLNEIIGMFSERDIHVMAITTIDTTDSTIVRLVVDYPDQGRKLLERSHLSYSMVEILAVEIPSADYLHRVTCALVQAEINIHYIYPFIMRPAGKSALAIRLEDNDIARDVLSRHQIRILMQNDIAR